MRQPLTVGKFSTTVLGALVVSTLVTSACSPDAQGRPAPQTATAANPRPADYANQTASRLGLGDGVTMRAVGRVDRPAAELVRRTLAGSHVRTAQAGTATDLVLGNLRDSRVTDALRGLHVSAPMNLGPEGYLFSAGRVGDRLTIVLAGADGAGQYYAAQRFQRSLAGTRIQQGTVVEQPDLPKRGVIEGFYGPPWTQADRLDQIRFYGDMRLNTYIYSPKDDPKLRSQWRSLYTGNEIAQLKQLVQAAANRHVTFDYALSPGLSMCYSSAADRAAVGKKFQQLYDIGVRDFNVPLDDIEYKWQGGGCADQSRYGAPTEGNVAKAHAEMLNAIQAGFIAKHPGTKNLEMVPTDYRGLGESDYTRALKATLNKKIAVMWTGKFVVPASISASDARAAQRMYGVKPFVWDNYPVNDFDFGRLMLGPYAHRGKDLPPQTAGIVLNPMPEASASKVALGTFADYAWNATNYNPYASRVRVARYLAHGDHATGRALLAFFDTENLPARPKSYTDPALEPQAPVLAGKIAAFEKAYKAGRRAQAVAAFRPYAQLLAGVQRQLSAGKADPRFAVDTREWLVALTLWAKALNRTLDALSAKAGGNAAGAKKAFADSAALARRAAAVTTKKVSDQPEPVVVADGVLDKFLQRAPKL